MAVLERRAACWSADPGGSCECVGNLSATTPSERPGLRSTPCFTYRREHDCSARYMQPAAESYAGWGVPGAERVLELSSARC